MRTTAGDSAMMNKCISSVSVGTSRLSWSPPLGLTLEVGEIQCWSVLPYILWFQSNVVAIVVAAVWGPLLCSNFEYPLPELLQDAILGTMFLSLTSFYRPVSRQTLMQGEWLVVATNTERCSERSSSGMRKRSADRLRAM